MRRAVYRLAAAGAVITLAAGCTEPIVLNPGPDFTDDVEQAYARAEQQQLRVATLTPAHWSRLEDSTGDIADRVHHASAPGNRFFVQVLHAVDRENDPAAPRFRAGLTDDCTYFPVATDATPEHTVAVARICLDNNGRVHGTWWRATDR
jgi:hypothetical protein